MRGESLICPTFDSSLSPLSQLEMKQRYLVKKMNVVEEREKDQGEVSMESLGEPHSHISYCSLQ